MRIDLTVPGEELLVTHEHYHKDHSHEDVYLAIRDAFDAMKHQQDNYARTRRAKVKKHESPGTWIYAQPEFRGGLRRDQDPGRTGYLFHCNSVLNNAFDSLEVDGEVRFVEEMGEKDLRRVQ